MNNKKGIIIGGIVVLIVAIVVIVLIFVQKAPQSSNTPNKQNAQNTNSEVVEIPTTVAEIEAMPVTTENIFVIKEDGSFSPKQMVAKYGERLFMTLSAEGEGKYVISSEDPVMAEILLILVNGGEEAKSVAFPVPAPGEYTFYVASTENPTDRSNTGTITIIE